MIGQSDDEVIDQWITQLKSDSLAKSQLARAVRSKEAGAIDVAVQWVVANVLRPAREAWDRAAAWVRSLLQ